MAKQKFLHNSKLPYHYRTHTTTHWKVKVQLVKMLLVRDVVVNVREGKMSQQQLLHTIQLSIY